MSTYDYDLFVIGAGSGGVRAARMSAAMGARVAIAEERYFGGTCVNVGCVPKKLFVYASHYADDFADARGFGWDTSTPAFDWATLRDNKSKEIQRLNGIYRRLLEQAGVAIFEQRARLLGPNSIQLGDRSLTARYILIATGGWPYVPHFPGAQWVKNSNDLFYLEHLPQTAVVVGGGYIAVEFAGILNGLGVATTLVYRGPQILRGFDESVREFLAEELAKKGITVMLNTDIAQIDSEDGCNFSVHLESGNQPKATVQTEMVLYATGRKPLLQDLGLEHVNVVRNASGEIEVDDFGRTSEPSIFAVGDVTPGAKLTPVALAEGMCVARHLFQGSQTPVDYSGIPTAVFSQPNIATVGLTESEARERYGKIRIYESRFKALKHTLSGRDERTLMKLVVNDADDRVLGAHMVGSEAGEIIQGIAIAIKAGATKQQFDSTIGIHPTAAEEFVTMREAVR